MQQCTIQLMENRRGMHYHYILLASVWKHTAGQLIDNACQLNKQCHYALTACSLPFLHASGCCIIHTGGPYPS